MRGFRPGKDAVSGCKCFGIGAAAFHSQEQHRCLHHRNASGIINGSVINYADEEMTLTGNSDLYFNRSGTTEVPAGFVPQIVLAYNPASYSETNNIFEY